MALFFWDPNGDEPVYASGLLNGHLGSADNLADLAAYNMSGLPNKLKAYVPGYGIYYYDNAGGYTADGLSVVNATGGGQWILDSANMAAGGGINSIELQSSDLTIGIEDLEESARTLNDDIQAKAPDIYTFQAWRGGITVTATSFQTVRFTIAQTGINFDRPDAVQIIPPAGYAGTLIQSAAYWRVQNTAETSFYNPTAGALTVPGGAWTIIAWRNKSDVITIS